MLAGFRSVFRRLAMQVIRQAQRDYVYVFQAQQISIIGEPAGNMMFLGERFDVRLGGRGHGDDLRLRNMLKGFDMKLGDELRTDDAYAHLVHADALSREATSV